MGKRWFIGFLILSAGLLIGATGYVLGNMDSNSSEQETVSSTDENTNSNNEKNADDTKERQEVIEATQDKVVKVEANDVQGSGFLYNDEGDIITNAHVVSGTKEADVTNIDDKTFSGNVIGFGDDQDIAVIRIEDFNGEEPLEMANEEAEIGQDVLALGSPLGLENTVTTGIISGTERDLDYGNYIIEEVYQISAPIAPGNSGGPLTDSQTGEVLGINTAGAEDSSIGFSIPIDKVIGVINDWSENPITSSPDEENINNESDQPEMAEENEAKEFISYFYERLNDQDYEAAYELLGSNWRENLTFEEFYEGYLDTRSVTIDDMTVASNDETIDISFRITAEEQDGDEIVFQQYEMLYQVGYEDGMMVLLSGEGEEI